LRARSAAYFDTSVLLKRYVMERGSDVAGELLARHDVVASVLLPVELTAALFRRRRDGSLRASQVDAAVRDLDADRRLWLLLDVTAPILRRVEDLVRTSALRTLDAIHVGSCLEARAIGDESLVFVTADVRQRRAAEAADLRVMWVA